MVLEIVDITMDPVRKADFEKAVATGIKETISRARGYLGYKLQAGIDKPGRYILMIYWETLENHTVDFRESEDFPKWRGHVGSYFLVPPVVEHFSLASESCC
jgi:heme-degrading monooxygenase HmoA